MSNWPIATAAPPLFVGSGSPDGVSAVLTSPTTTSPSAWVQIIAATPGAVSALHLVARAPYEQRCLVEIGIGPAGSEQVVATVPFLSRGNRNGVSGPNFHHPPVALPLALPAGVRVAARITCAQGVANTLNLTTHIQLVSALAPIGFPRATFHGLDANLFLTTVTANGINYGAWVQIVAAAAFPVRAVMLATNQGFTGGVSGAGGRTQYELGVGAAGSEVPIYTIPNGMVFADIPSYCYSPVIYGNHPAGTRFAVRCRVEGGIWENSAGLILFG